MLLHPPNDDFFLSLKVFRRLQKKQICTSKKVAIKSLDELGRNFDSNLKEWQTKLMARTVDSAHIQWLCLHVCLCVYVCV